MPGRWQGRLPGHKVLGVLKEVSGSRVVLRTRLGEEEAVTRVVLTALPRQYGAIVQEIALRGRGTPAGLPEEALLVLEGYRAASAARGVKGLPTVLDAGVLPPKGDKWPKNPGVEATGPLYVTTSWVEGRPLDAAWPHMDGQARDGALQRVLQILEGLHHNHVAFGDLKPSNIVAGPDGVHLIDLDTMREVSAPNGFAVTRDITPRFAAPEQQYQRVTYLSSDLYAFGAMVLSLHGCRLTRELPQPWRTVVGACMCTEPLQRPLTWHLWRLSCGETQELRTWDGGQQRGQSAPAGGGSWHDPEVGLGRGGATERVPEPQVGGGVTERVAEPPGEAGGVTERVAEPVEPQGGAGQPPLEVLASLDSENTSTVDQERLPGRWARVRRRLLWGAAGLLVLALVAAVVTGVQMWNELQRRQAAIQTADAMAADVLSALMEHKTVAEKNTRPVLDKVVAQAQAAVDVAETPDALGALALARVWQQRWHWSGARWDPDAFQEADALTHRALEAGHTSVGLLARALLAGAACRLMPDSQGSERGVWCEESARRFKEAQRRMPSDTGSQWLRVELRWGAVMTRSGEGMRFRGQGQEREAREAFEEAFAHCEAAWPLLDSAPVNGVELLQDCLPVAGEVEDYGAYIRYAQRLLAQDERDDGQVGKRNLERVFRGGLSACHELKTERDGAIRVSRPMVDDPATFCSYLGQVAAGCVDDAYAILPFRLRMVWVFELPYGRLPVAEKLPWGALLKAAKDAEVGACRL